MDRGGAAPGGIWDQGRLDPGCDPHGRGGHRRDRWAGRPRTPCGSSRNPPGDHRRIDRRRRRAADLRRFRGAPGRRGRNLRLPAP